MVDEVTRTSATRSQDVGIVPPEDPGVGAGAGDDASTPV